MKHLALVLKIIICYIVMPRNYWMPTSSPYLESTENMSTQGTFLTLFTVELREKKKFSSPTLTCKSEILCKVTTPDCWFFQYTVIALLFCILFFVIFALIKICSLVMVLSENFRPYEVIADFETPVTVFEHYIFPASISLLVID